MNMYDDSYLDQMTLILSYVDFKNLHAIALFVSTYIAYKQI